MNKFIGEKEFSIGYLTLIDFIIAEDSHFIEGVFPEESKQYPFLRKIRENFQKLPEIVAYTNSDKAFKGRFYPPTAFISIDK